MAEVKPISERIVTEASDVYLKRVGEGSVFGERTAEFLPVTADSTPAEVNQEILTYFSELTECCHQIFDKYALRELYSPAELQAFQEMLVTVCYTYGIQREVLYPDQNDFQKLCLLGVAEELVALHAARTEPGLTPEIKQELAVTHGRLVELIKIISQNGDTTHSISLSKWYGRAKRGTTGSPERVAAYKERATDLSRFISDADNETLKIWIDRFQKARELRDDAASEALKQNLTALPEIQRVLEVLGLSEVHDLEIIVTTLGLDEFRKVFGSDGFMSGNIIVLSKEGTQYGKHVTAHELAHTLASLKKKNGLSVSANEAMIENSTQVPRTYSKDRLLYGTLDLCIANWGSGQSPEAINKLRYAAAVTKALREHGSDENSESEVAWNSLLLTNFGLAGFLYYYSVPTTNVDPIQKKLPLHDEALHLLLDKLRVQKNSNTFANSGVVEVLNRIFSKKFGALESIDVDFLPHEVLRATTPAELKLYLQLYEAYCATQGKIGEKCALLRMFFAIHRGLPISSFHDCLGFVRTPDGTIDATDGYNFYRKEFIDPTACGICNRKTEVEAHTTEPLQLTEEVPLSEIEQYTYEVQPVYLYREESYRGKFLEMVQTHLQPISIENKLSVYYSLLATLHTHTTLFLG